MPHDLAGLPSPMAVRCASKPVSLPPALLHRTAEIGVTNQPETVLKTALHDKALDARLVAALANVRLAS
jgi:hypothetical protein